MGYDIGAVERQLGLWTKGKYEAPLVPSEGGGGGGGGCGHGGHGGGGQQGGGGGGGGAKRRWDDKVLHDDDAGRMYGRGTPSHAHVPSCTRALTHVHAHDPRIRHMPSHLLASAIRPHRCPCVRLHLLQAAPRRRVTPRCTTPTTRRSR